MAGTITDDMHVAGTLARRIFVGSEMLFQGYTVPRDVVFLAELPRNTTGKILERGPQ